MQQKIIFTAGMDSDTAPELFGQDKARKRVNVRVLSSDNDQVGSIETVHGNVLVAYTLPSGLNTVIGSIEDIKNKKVYYFVYNDNNFHQILEYDYVVDSVSLVLAEALSAPFYLRFSLDNLITGVNIVQLDDLNPLLYWTDDYVDPLDDNVYNEPKKLNIRKAKLFSSGDYVNGYPSPFEPRFITRIKQPPLQAPTYSWSTDSAQKINHFDKTFFKFKVQFVYDDNEISAWSPETKYIFPETENLGGSGEDLKYINNKITIAVPTGSGIVTRIRISGKRLQVGSTAFSLIADISKSVIGISSDTTYNFDFFNDGNYIQLEDNESVKLYDNVPQRSKAQEVIQGQRIVDANVTENFDAVPIDVRFPLSYELLDIPTNPHFVNTNYLKSGGVYKKGIVYYDDFGNRSGLTNTVVGKTTEMVGDVYGTTLFVPFLTDPLYGAPHYVPNTDMAYIPVVGSEIYSAPPKWATHYQILRSKNEAMSRFIQFVAQTVTYLDINKAVTTTPANYVYVVLDITNITGRYLVENPNSELVYDWVKGDRLRILANYTPDPTSFSYTQIEPFFSFNDSEIIGWNPGYPSVMIKLDPTIPTVLTAGCLFEIYTPAKSVINDNEFTYEIAESGDLSYDSDGNFIHEGAIANQSYTAVSSSTVAGGLNQFYFCMVPIGHVLTVGRKVKITGSGWSIYGTVVYVYPSGDQVEIDTTGFTLFGTYDAGVATIIAAAESTLSGGDCFRRYCDMPWADTLSFVYRLYQFIETSSASNLFTSNADDYGRPNRIDPLIKRVTRPTTIYWSENFVPETFINGLSSVYDSSFETYEQRYGSIQKLFTENMGLLMLQEQKCSMVPVSRLLYGDLSLQNTVGASTAVLSPQSVPYAGEFGIGKHPESFAVYASSKYFIDVNRAAVLRLSIDGLTPISDVGSMHNYFTDRCNAIVKSGQRPNITGVYDVKFNEYILSFQEYIVGGMPPVITSAETLAWNERTNQWSTFYSYYPDYMNKVGAGIISFKDGSIYKHNVDLPTNYNTFYGTFTPSEFWAVFNVAPSNVKILQSISEETNAPWEVYSILTPNGQSSNLIESDFDEKENNQYAALWKDILTPNVTYPLINGDIMRDRTMLAKFRYNSDDYNKITAVNFDWIVSNLSNR